MIKPKLKGGKNIKTAKIAIKLDEMVKQVSDELDPKLAETREKLGPQLKDYRPNPATRQKDIAPAPLLSKRPEPDEPKDAKPPDEKETIPPNKKAQYIDVLSPTDIQAGRTTRAQDIANDIITQIQTEIIELLAYHPDAYQYRYQCERDLPSDILGLVGGSLIKAGWKLQLDGDYGINLELPPMQEIAPPVNQAQVSKVKPL